MEIKTVILPLDKDGIANSVEEKLVNQHLNVLRSRNYFSSSHVIMNESTPSVIVDANNGRVYVKQYCMCESLIMVQLPINV